MPQIQITAITELRLNKDNPRVIKDDKFKKLVKSIQDFPQMLEIRPIVVNEEMVVLGGNMRLKACIEAGLTEVPIIKASSLTPEQQKEFIIKDNVGFGEWEWDVLANEWDVKKLTDWGLDIPDYKIKEYQASDDEFEVPEIIETDIVLGDLFEIGEHKLLCGDATQTDSYKKLLNNELGDLVVTDPPYNVNYEGSNGLKIANDNMDDNSFYQFLYDFYTALNAYLKKGAAWYVWHADSEGANFRKAMKDAKILFKQCLIWVKNSLVLGRQDYQWQHEPCLYGWKDGGSHFWKGGRKQTTILEFDKPKRNKEHPTMKPIELIGYQIGNSSKPGELVIDAFGGSGSTMVAAHQMKRKAYLIEFDPKYCQVIIDRMRKLDPSLIIKKNGVVTEYAI
jgi:DNA modification methylase